VETRLVAVNRVLARYTLKTVEDYEQMKGRDLQEILDILDTLTSGIAEAE